MQGPTEPILAGAGVRGPTALADAVLAAAILGLAVCLGLATTPWCAPPFDCMSYLAMARDPLSARSIQPQHAARILPPALVYLLGRAGVEPLRAFQALTVAGFAALGRALYASFRLSGASPLAAGSGVLWLCVVPWPFANHFKDVAQAGFGWTFPAFLAIASLAERRRSAAIAAVGLAAALCRQELILAPVLALAEVAWRERRWRPLAWAAADVLAFAVVLRATSPGAQGYASGAMAGLTPRVVAATVLPWMVSGQLWAFLPMLAVAWRPVGAALRRAPWIACYVLAVLAVEIANARLAGPHNFGRLVLLAAFPVWWLTAREVLARAAPAWVWGATAVVWACYAALRRDVIETAGPAIALPYGLSIPWFGLLAPLAVLALVGLGGARREAPAA